MAVVAACIHVATARSNATAFRIAGVATLLRANGDNAAENGYPDTTDPAEVSDGSLAQAPNRFVWPAATVRCAVAQATGRRWWW